jgi:hypothetical protein
MRLLSVESVEVWTGDQICLADMLFWRWMRAELVSAGQSQSPADFQSTVSQLSVKVHQVSAVVWCHQASIMDCFWCSQSQLGWAQYVCLGGSYPMSAFQQVVCAVHAFALFCCELQLHA